MQQQRNTNYQKNIGSATLFALAILILAFSCPMKRLLKNNFSSQTSLLSHPKPANSSNHFTVFYGENAACAAGLERVALPETSHIQPQKSGVPDCTRNISEQSGYSIHYFSNGIEAVYGLAPASDYSSLPLFLQHRSLLI